MWIGASTVLLWVDHSLGDRTVVPLEDIVESRGWNVVLDVDDRLKLSIPHSVGFYFLLADLVDLQWMLIDTGR